MLQRFTRQGRLDLDSIADLQLNLECRDEIVPILAGLQHVFQQSDLRLKLAKLIEADINEDSRSDLEREGFSYWQVVVLATVRLGCNLDYDKLQDLAENHRALRCLLQVGDWDDTSFGWRRIRDTLCLLTTETVRKINHAIVSYGQTLHGDARSEVRADSFVGEILASGGFHLHLQLQLGAPFTIQFHSLRRDCLSRPKTFRVSNQTRSR